MTDALPAATTAPASQATAIPFRDAPAAGTGDAATAFGAAILLLMAAVAALLWARRRGWLARWTVAPAAATRASNRLSTLETLRLSRNTVVHRVSDGGTKYLVVESTRQVNVVRTAGAQEQGHD